MNTQLWVAALLIVGLAVMMLEVFVPSGGVLGFISVVSIGAAVVTAFVEQGTGFGLLVLSITCAAVPAVLGLAFRWFPETPLGRRVLPPPPEPDDVAPHARKRRQLRGLVGLTGRATTEMLPWGSVTVNGQACEALAEGGPIAGETEVEVVGVQGTKLVVRAAGAAGPSPGGAAGPSPGSAAGGPDPAGPSSPAERPAGGPPSRLSRTLEEFDFEKLEPPAA